MQIFDELEGAFGAAGDGVGQKIDILEPHDALAAEHRDRLHALAETIHRGLDFADVAGETADDFAGILVGDLGGQGVETFLAEAADEKIVGAADKGKCFRGGHGSKGGIWSGSGGGRTKKIATRRAGGEAPSRIRDGFS